jgi:low affinity Fe/Cu permease
MAYPFREWLTQLGVWTASPIAFAVVGLYALAWIVFDPDSLNWHGVATLCTWVMTLFIQRAEHRDTQAIHGKLDELLRAQGGPEAISPSLTNRSRKKSNSTGATSGNRSGARVGGAAYLALCLELREHFYDIRAQLRHVNCDDFPQAWIFDALVLMSQDVANPDNCRPGRVGIAIQQLRWQCPGRFGNDLDRTFGSPPKHITSLVFRECYTFQSCGQTVDLIPDVKESDRGTLAGRHQKILTASRSTSART